MGQVNWPKQNTDCDDYTLWVICVAIKEGEQVGRPLEVTKVARMHSKGKGKSGSDKPNISAAPDWSESDKKAVEDLILKLSGEGHSTAMIGTILRDQHAVPDARLVTGERIAETLERNGIGGRYPEDMMNLMRQALRMIDHLDANHKDLHNRRQLELTESRIRRLARYYRSSGKLDSDWVYKRDQLRLMVE